MSDYFFDETELRANAEQLSHRAKVVWALLCAERLFPNYQVFHEKHGWGRPDAIREALDWAWQWLTAKSPAKPPAAPLLAAVEAAEPDTEDFDSLYVSPALDAATAAGSLLRLAIEDRVEHLVAVASFSRDTVDMYVQELETMAASDPDLEERIRLHPLMQRELQRQAEDLILVRRLKGIAEEIEQLKAERRAPAASSIDVAPAKPGGGG
jgi:uncharacterized protein